MLKGYMKFSIRDLLKVDGMIIRLLLLVVAAGMHIYFYYAFFTKNFEDGLYPAEADSTGIPIFTTQIMIVGATVCASPIILLGSRYIRDKVRALRLWVSLPLLGVFLCCYLLILGISMGGALRIFDVRYREIAYDAIWLFLVPFAYLVIDTVRLVAHVRPDFWGSGVFVSGD